MKATIEQLKDLLDERIVVLDGSYGVLIQKTVRGEEAYRGERLADHPRDLAGDPDLLNLTQPEVVRDIHRAYLAAGADIVTTNTFTASPAAAIASMPAPATSGGSCSRRHAPMSTTATTAHSTTPLAKAARISAR